VGQQQVAVEVDVVAETCDLRGRRDAQPGLEHAAEHDAEVERAGGVGHLDRLADAAGLRQLDRDPVRSLGAGRDVERVRAVRGAADVPLQVDVNEAWTIEEALDALPQLADLGVEYCEQPLAAGDPRGAELKRDSPIPIYVDEDCHTLADVAACAERAHGINVKLAKSGGIREAVRMVHAARALGLGCMLGCMIESGLGIAAAAHIASLFDHVDLDGNLLLALDPWPGVQFADGVQIPADLPGLGVSPA